MESTQKMTMSMDCMKKRKKMIHTMKKKMKEEYEEDYEEDYDDY